MTSDHESVIDRLNQDIVQLQRKISDSDSDDGTTKLTTLN